MTEEPVVRSARREALVTLIIWALALVYTIGSSLWHGYGRSEVPEQFVLGFPDWVFWSIIAPWLVCVAVSWWFAYRFMTDEPLGDDGADLEIVEPPEGS